MKKHSRFNNKMLIIIFFIAISIILLVFIFSYSSSTTKTVYTKNKTLDEINCTSKYANNIVLSDTGNPVTQDHVLRIIFNDNKLYSIFYIYNGKYNSDDEAKMAEAAVHANYNTFLQNLKVDTDTYSPVYSVLDDNFKMSIYADSSNLRTDTAKIFFLDGIESNSDLTTETVKVIVEGQGFSCSAQ